MLVLSILRYPVLGYRKNLSSIQNLVIFSLYSYILPSLCDSAEACMRALLGDEVGSSVFLLILEVLSNCLSFQATFTHLFSFVQQLPPLAEEHLRNRPNKNAVKSLERVLSIHSKYWLSLKRTQTQVQYSMLEAKLREKEEAETVSALTSLSLQVVADDSSK